MTAEEAQTFERCISVGGVALFPADTVYGLGTEPDSREGVDRLYRLKGRSPDPRRLEDVDERIGNGVDLALDGGELPGTPSTVLDLTSYEEDGTHTILREGAVPAAEVAARL